MHDKCTKMLLAAMYQSLARPVELSFKDGRTAHGLFSGFDHATSALLVSNFCFANSETSEPSRQINMSELVWFVVRENPVLHMGSAKTAKSAANSSATTPVRGRDLLANGASGAGSLHGPDKLPPKDPQRGIKNDVFRTDVEISKRTAEAKPSDKKVPSAKVFQRFAEPLNSKLPLGTLENDGKMGEWDQFQANHDAFGIRSEFNENDYTTELDLKSVSKKALQNAERLAQEILASEKDAVAASRHRQEDRNEIELMDNDNEEDLFSNVVREKPSPVEPEPKRKDPQVPKPAFNLKKVPAEKGKSFRGCLAKNVAEQKLQSGQSQLINQLNESRGQGQSQAQAQTQSQTPSQPQTHPQGQDVYTNPAQKQQVFIPMAYPPQAMGYMPNPYTYYSQGIYYNAFPAQPQMYPQQGYYPQPK